MQIVVIGAGNLASCISPVIADGGHRIVQIIAKSVNTAKSLATKLGAEFDTNLQSINTAADIYLIATPDREIEPVVKNLPKLEGILVHCSGGTSMEILRESKGKGYGVLYPFQTFSKTRVIDFNKVPFFVEANNFESLQDIKRLANSLSSLVYDADSDTRSWIHLSGVFSNNFINHLLKISSQILENKTISNEILKPLLAETISKAFTLGPSNSQTGPAIRNDRETMNKHIQMLNQLNPELAKIYKELSLSIQSSK